MTLLPQALLAVLAAVLAFNAYRIQKTYSQQYSDVAKMFEIDDEIPDIYGLLDLKTRFVTLWAATFICVIVIVVLQCTTPCS